MTTHPLRLSEMREIENLRDLPEGKSITHTHNHNLLKMNSYTLQMLKQKYAIQAEGSAGRRAGGGVATDGAPPEDIAHRNLLCAVH